MIVTCPGCASKYRVRNEAVPAEGARMRCPKCETLFLAKPPAGGDGEPSSATDTGLAPPAGGPFGMPANAPGFGPPPQTGASFGPGQGAPNFGAPAPA